MMAAAMRLNSVAPDLTVRIAVEIVTELLRFIFIKIEFPEAPFSHMSSCEQEDRGLHQGLDFHSAVVHCLISPDVEKSWYWIETQDVY
jgi:hypothetical protein